MSMRQMWQSAIIIVLNLTALVNICSAVNINYDRCGFLNPQYVRTHTSAVLPMIDEHPSESVGWSNAVITIPIDHIARIHTISQKLDFLFLAAHEKLRNHLEGRKIAALIPEPKLAEITIRNFRSDTQRAVLHMRDESEAWESSIGFRWLAPVRSIKDGQVVKGVSFQIEWRLCTDWSRLTWAYSDFPHQPLFDWEDVHGSLALANQARLSAGQHEPADFSIRKLGDFGGSWQENVVYWISTAQKRSNGATRRLAGFESMIIEQEIHGAKSHPRAVVQAKVSGIPAHVDVGDKLPGPIKTKNRKPEKTGR